MIFLIHYRYLIIAVSCCLISCQMKREVSLEVLKAYALDPENGLQVEDEKNGVRMEMVYRPKDLVIAQHAGTEDKVLWDSTKAELRNYDYFILRISRNNKEIENHFAADPTRYGSVVDYLSGHISQDIVLTAGDKEVRVSEVLFTPSYGMANASSILLVFESDLESLRQDCKVVFTDTQFGTGRHEFEFDYDVIARIPTIKH